MTDSNIAYALCGHPDDEATVIDLGRTVFIQPLALVVSACLIERAQRDGRPLNVVPPGQSDPASYCSRMGLGRLTENAGLPNSFPPVRRHDPDRRFVELSRCGDVDTVHEFIELVEHRLDDWEDDSLKSVLYDNLIELAMNVEDHAEAPGYMAAQWYPTKGAVHFAIGDCGIGIRASLASGGVVRATDTDAVLAAAQVRVSRFSSDRGFGIPSTIRTLTDRGATLTILSGDALVNFRPRSAIPTRLSCPWPGTLVSAELPWTFAT